MWDFCETVFRGVMERVAPILVATFLERRQLYRRSRRRQVEPVFRDELHSSRIFAGTVSPPTARM